MKSLHLLIAAPILFLLGVLAGREIFPPADQPPGEPPAALSQRTPRKKKQNRPEPGQSQVNVATASGIAGLLALVDDNDPFTTSTRLRASLQDLSPAGLETLILDLAATNLSRPGAYTLRTSLLNHLVAKDPFHALDMLLASRDYGFQASGMPIIMRAIARLGSETIRDAIARIDNPQLRQQAQNIALQPHPDSTPAELLALLESDAAQGFFPIYGSYQPYGNWGGDLWGSHYGSSSFPVFNNSTGTALAQLAQKDFASAESYVLGLENEAQRRNALAQIAQGLAHEDPDRALEWARRQDSQATRDQIIQGILSTLAAKDPARAASLLGEIGNPGQRGSGISVIAAHWANTDPQAAIAWAESLPPTNARLNAVATIARQLAQTDPRTAINLTGSLPGQTRQQLIPGMIGQWAGRDFESARDWVTSQQDPFMLQTALSGFISSWTQQNPNEAAAFLQQAATDQAGSQQLQNQLSALARQWAGQDREAAFAWANSLENEAHRSHVLGGIHNEWTASDPSGAAQYLNTVTDPGLRSQLIGGIASSLATQDPDSVEAWLNTLPADERFTAADSTFSALRYQNPEIAAGLYDRLAREAGDDQERLNAIGRQADDIAGQWANHSPRDAAEWAAGIPSEQHRADAFGNIAGRWANFDPTGAAQWLDSLPDGSPRDEATQNFVQHVRQFEPATAFAWADTISDDSTRYRSLRDAVNYWNQSSPEAAREAISSANLSAEQRENLLRQLR